MAVKKKVVEIDTKEAQQQVDQLKESMAGLNKENNAATASVKELRKELKAQKDIMLSAEQGTKEYNDALQKAANIQHTLKEQMEEVNASAMDFGQIAGNVVKATGGIVAGFQAAKATMNLFGIENEAVLQSLEKMQNLMAITQAIPVLDDSVKAFKRLGLAIKGATAGMNSFKVALISTGIGAAVVAVGLLAANWDKVTDAMKRWGIIHEDTKKKLEEEKKKIEEWKDKLQYVNDEIQKQETADKIAGLNEEAKKSYDELTKSVTRLQAEQKKVEADRQIEWRENGQRTERARELTDQFNSLTKQIDDLHKAQRDLLNDTNNTKEAAEAAEKAAEALQAVKDAYAKLREEISLYGKTDEEQNIIKINKEEQEKKKILEESWKKRIISDEEYQTQLTAITTHYEEERTNITEKYAKERDDKAKDEEAKRQEEARKWVENQLSTIEYGYGQQLLLISQKELELAEQRANGGITNEEYQEQLNTYLEQEIQSYISALEKELQVEGITADEKLAIQQRLVDAKIQLNEMQVANAEDAANREVDKWMTAAGAIGNIFNSLGDLMEEGSEEQKAFQIMGATINMLAGITAAMSGLFTTKSGPWDIALAVLQATAIATSGAANIAKMAKTNKNNAASSVSSARTSTAALGSIVAPVQYTQDIQGANIEGAIKDTRVYVTEGDISSTQKRVNVAESENRY